MPVPGVSIGSAVKLGNRYPALWVLLGDAGDSQQAVQDITAAGPDVLAAIIAAGVGACDDIDVEADVAALSMDSQLDLLSAVLEVTMPHGPVPFFEKVGRVFGLLAPARKSHEPNQSSSQTQPSPPPSFDSSSQADPNMNASP